MMESPLFSLESLIDTWQETTPPWVMETIFAIVCGELLFLVLLPWLENDPSSPPLRNHRHARQRPVESRRRSRKKACRVCLQELEKARELITLLRSHLGRPPDLGGFRQFFCQDPFCEVYDTALRRADRPCGEPAGDAAPATSPSASPAPLTMCLLPLASTLSPGRTVSSVSRRPQASPSASRPPGPLLPLDRLLSLAPALSHSWPCLPDSEAHTPPPTAPSLPPPPDTTLTLPRRDTAALPLGTVPHNSRPLHPRLASPSPAISGYGRAGCPVRVLSCWQMPSKSTGPSALSASSQCESQQEPASQRPPDASLPEDPTDRQAEVGSPSFVHPGVQELLEMWEGKEKEGSGYPRNSLENKFQSLGAEPDTDRGASHGHRSGRAVPGDLLLPELKERLEQHLRKRSALRQHGHQGGLPCGTQLSMELTKPRGPCPGRCPAPGAQGPVPPSGPASESSQDPERGRRSFPAKTPRGTDQDEAVAHSVGRIFRGICSGLAGLPVQVLEMSYQKSRADSLASSTRVPDKGVGTVHWDRNFGPTTDGQIPVDVGHSRLGPSHALDLPGESRNPVSLKDWEPRVKAPRECSARSPHPQQERPKKFRGRSRRGLPFKVLKPIRLFKLTKAQRSFMLRSLFTWPSICVHRAHLKANADKFLAEPAPPPPREKVMKQSVPTPASPLPAPSPACEKIQSAPGGTPPGDRHEPAKAPMTGQEGRLPSQPLKYVSVGRIWHSETVTEAGTGSRGSRPASAVTRKEPNTESAGMTSEKSLQDVTRLEIDSECPSLGAEEAREVMEVKEVPDWEVTSEPPALAKPRTINANLRRSRSPGPSTNSSPSTALVPRDPGEPCFDLDAQLSDCEVRELVESEKRPPGPATGVLLEDCETGALLQNYATDALPGDCNSDAFLAADLLASQRSPFGSQSLSSGDMSASQELRGRISSGGSCQQGSLSLQDHRKSQSKMCVPPDEREDNRRPRLARRASRASGLSRAWDQNSSRSSGSQSCQLGRKRQAPPERPLKKRTKHFPQSVLPQKGKGPKDPPQNGPPASATARSWDSVSSRSAADRRPAEAQVLMTAVSHSAEEKTAIHQGLHAPQLNCPRGEPQASGDQRLCQQSVLRYEEQRGVTQDMAGGHQAIGNDRTGSNKSRCTRDRSGQWAFPPREPGAPGRPGQFEQKVAGPSVRPRHCPRHCPFRRYVSCGQPDCPGHGFPCRTFLQRESHTLRRETVVCRAVTAPSLPMMPQNRLYSRGLGPLCAGYCGLQGRWRTERS